jgi:phosphoribosylglycinamide formyltransferase 1
MKRIAMLISGGGTTATEILNACKEGGKLYGLIKPALVISSSREAKGLIRTLDTGMIQAADQKSISRKSFETPEAFGQAILKECKSRDVDFVGQYGWMERTPTNVIESYFLHMSNQHPGPIDPGHPSFGGDYMHGRRVHFSRLMFVRETKRDYWTEATAQRVASAWDVSCPNRYSL